MHELLVVYIPCPNFEQAEQLVEHLLMQRVIACAQLIEANSRYRWEGRLVKDTEVIVIAKTIAQHYELLEREVLQKHPYQTPCIVVFPAKANDAYGAWVQQEVG